MASPSRCVPVGDSIYMSHVVLSLFHVCIHGLWELTSRRAACSSAPASARQASFIFRMPQPRPRDPPAADRRWLMGDFLANHPAGGSTALSTRASSIPSEPADTMAAARQLRSMRISGAKALKRITSKLMAVGIPGIDKCDAFASQQQN